MATYRYGLGAYLSGKVVEPAEEVGMDLLEALHRARLHTVEDAALKQRVGFLLTLTVDGVVAIDEPVEEGACAVVGIVFGQGLNTLGIQCVSVPFLYRTSRCRNPWTRMFPINSGFSSRHSLAVIPNIATFSKSASSAYT